MTRWLLVGDGASIHVRRLAVAIRDSGIDVHVACFEGEPLPGVGWHRLGAWPAAADRRYLLAVPRFRGLLRRLQPDVVNAHYLSSYGLLAAFGGHPVLVQTLWGSDLLVTARRPPRRALARFALRCARLITGDSTGLLADAARLAPLVSQYRFVFGPPAWLFEARRRPEGIILSPRSHEPLYRVDAVLDAWASSGGRLGGMRLVVAGTGSQTGLLRERRGEAIEFTGALHHDELLNLMLRADVMVSVPQSDATSASVLEALAARCPVVASDIPANREWLAADALVPVGAPPCRLVEAIAAARTRPVNLDRRWSFAHQVAGFVTAVDAATRNAPITTCAPCEAP